MKRLEQRIAIVTGAGQGIGRAIALGLGREGAGVVIADVNEGPANA
jgi:NAD(P)-dependent dehydrogenase (short-subunit alcohol dehydrogenase family)